MHVVMEITNSIYRQREIFQLSSECHLFHSTVVEVFVLTVRTTGPELLHMQRPRGHAHGAARRASTGAPASMHSGDDEP